LPGGIIREALRQHGGLEGACDLEFRVHALVGGLEEGVLVVELARPFRDQPVGSRSGCTSAAMRLKVRQVAPSGCRV
jgi:hypothetical protein